jgi:hypothetical protein
MKKIYETIGQETGAMVDKKNDAYGDAIHTVPKILELLYPKGIDFDKFQDLALIVRILDKICRIAKGNEINFEETPYKDIAGYGILGQEIKELSRDNCPLSVALKI